MNPQECVTEQELRQSLPERFMTVSNALDYIREQFPNDLVGGAVSRSAANAGVLRVTISNAYDSIIIRTDRIKVGGFRHDAVQRAVLMMAIDTILSLEERERLANEGV